MASRYDKTSKNEHDLVSAFAGLFLAVFFSECLDGMGEGDDISSDAFFLIDPMIQPDHGGLNIDVILRTGHQQVDVVSFRQCA